MVIEGGNFSGMRMSGEGESVEEKGKNTRRRRRRCLACRVYCVTQGQVMEREC